MNVRDWGPEGVLNHFPRIARALNWFLWGVTSTKCAVAAYGAVPFQRKQAMQKIGLGINGKLPNLWAPHRPPTHTHTSSNLNGPSSLVKNPKNVHFFLMIKPLQIRENLTPLLANFHFLKFRHQRAAFCPLHYKSAGFWGEQIENRRDFGRRKKWKSTEF